MLGWKIIADDGPSGDEMAADDGPPSDEMTADDGSPSVETATDDERVFLYTCSLGASVERRLAFADAR